MAVQSYQAFISYSHSADQRLSAELQHGLQRVAKPWYRRSSIKVFRDETSLAANAMLWDAIAGHLQQCAHFILLASPESAISPWVAREVDWWLTNRSVQTLLIAVTGGVLQWDAAANDFDWLHTDCLPVALKGRFIGEPLYVDLRWRRNERDPKRFRDAVLTLAAPLAGRAKDELDSDEIRQHRHFRIAVGAALSIIAGMTVWGVVSQWQAGQQGRLADQNWRESESRRLAADALVRAQGGETGLGPIAMALMAWRLAPTAEARHALAGVDQASAGIAQLLGQHTRGIAAIAFSGDSARFATQGLDGTILQWDTRSWSLVGQPLTGAPSPKPNCGGAVASCNVTALTYDEHHRHLVAWDRSGAMQWWDLDRGTSQTIAAFKRPGVALRAVTIHDEGGLIAVAGDHGLLSLWNPASQQLSTAPVGLADWRITGVCFLKGDAVMALATKAYAGSRALRWPYANGPLELGPIATLPAGNYHEADGVEFDRAGTRAILNGVSGSGLVAIEPNLELRELPLPADRGRLDDFALSADGSTVFARQSNVWSRWDVGRQPATAASGPIEPSWARVTWSPDARWRVEQDHDDLQIWDAKVSAAGAPSTAIRTSCRFEREDACLPALCRKIEAVATTDSLRKLFGIRDFVVMYDKYPREIGGKLC